MTKFSRQLHRWCAVIFTITVATVFIASGMGTTVEWIYYLPLLPLALMFFSGIVMFLQPYLKRQG